MTAYARVFALLSVATGAVYVISIWLGAQHLVVGSEKLWPFDQRPLGYGFFDAKTYLMLLKEEGSAFYLGPMRLLDTAFPILLGFWMGMLWWGLTTRIHPWSRVIMLIAPAAFTMMDLCENALIAEMVRLGPEGIDRDLVVLASSYTVSKYVTLLVAILVLGGMALQRSTRVG
ncbi:hypothetical protein NBRC116590_10860 [Pelagimonas sp. KU-00592-HH]|uniref:hypothetical protein n=1 Tax=Pelagimonas sp. KU-00592-HH TaxID=3127651 RepID=UPI003104AD48